MGSRRLPLSGSSLFKAWMLIWIRCEQRLPPTNAGALRFKKIAPFRSKERRTVLSPIEFQKETSVRLEEPCANIVDEKFPISRRPLEPLSVFSAGDAMEADAVGSHEIKSFSKIR